MEILKGDSIAILEYHLSDSFENADDTGRIMYYFSGAIPLPTAIFNGTREVIGAEPGVLSDYLSIYHAELLTDSPCGLNIFVDYDSTTRILKIKSKVTAVDAFSNAHLRYAIAESHIYHHWGSHYLLELDSLHHVVRKMLPDYNGIPIPAMNPYDTFVDSQTHVLDSTWNEKNCYVVVFVQKDSRAEFDKPVLRSAKSGLFETLTWVFGDANGDSTVNLEDIVYLRNYLFVHGPPPYPQSSGDSNSNCIVNIADIVYLINYIFKNGPEPLEGCAR